MRLLVDTSAYSVAMLGQREAVAALREASELVVSPVVLGELLGGFDLGTRQRQNRSLLEQFLAGPRVRQVAVTRETAEHYALIFRALAGIGRPIPTNDMWIAASAMEHGLRVLTTDTHFRCVPLLLVEYIDVRAQS